MRAYRIYGGLWSPCGQPFSGEQPPSGGGTGGGTNPTPVVDARFFGDPGTTNMYYGSSWDGADVTEWINFSKQCGGLGVSRRYYQSNQVTGSANFDDEAAKLKAAGALIAASFKVPGNNWASVANGSQDAWLDSIASVVSDHGDAAFICLHHEPYNGQTGTGDGGTATDFRNMYTRAKARWSGVENLLMMPIYNGYPIVDNDPVWHDYIIEEADIQGVDIYPRKMQSREQTWAKYGKGLGNLATVGQPMFLAEYGARPSIQGDYCAPMIRDIYDYLVYRGDVIGCTYFNSGKNVNTDDPSTYLLDGVRLDVFKQCAALPNSIVPAEL